MTTINGKKFPKREFTHGERLAFVEVFNTEENKAIQKLELEAAQLSNRASELLSRKTLRAIEKSHAADKEIESLISADKGVAKARAEYLDSLSTKDEALQKEKLDATQDAIEKFEDSKNSGIDELDNARVSEINKAYDLAGVDKKHLVVEYLNQLDAKAKLEQAATVQRVEMFRDVLYFMHTDYDANESTAQFSASEQVAQFFTNKHKNTDYVQWVRGAGIYTCITEVNEIIASGNAQSVTVDGEEETEVGDQKKATKSSKAKAKS